MSSESEESLFWDEKQCYGSRTIIDDDEEESGGATSKRIRLSPEFNQQQEGDADSSGQTSSPLGLTLRKTPSFLSLLQRSLSKGKNSGSSKQDNQSSSHHVNVKHRTKVDHEKLKASNFPAIFIKIGSWQRMTRNEGDLTAKLYYAKRKLVWEVLDGALKSKIEIQWSDIVAITATTPDNEPGTLEIELNQPPLFYREINPQPRKHTLWQQASDFTGGQAPIWRRHYVRFAPGVLDKHYEKLLQVDPRLHALSQKPFPCHESPYFDPTMFGISELSLNFSGYGSCYPPRVQYPYQTYSTALTRTHPVINPNSTISVMDLPSTNEGVSNNQFFPQPPTIWGNQGPSNQVFHTPDYQSNFGLVNNIKSHLLGESQAVSSDDGNMDSMCSLLESTNMNLNYNNSETSYQFAANTAGQVMQNRVNVVNTTADHGANVYPFMGGTGTGTTYPQQHVNWLPHEVSNDMQEAMHNSVPSFLFPGSGDFR